jgi:hypothetical protein
METSQTPDSATLRRLLDRLEPFSAHPGTIEIHDPLYLLLKEPSQAHLASLSAALEAFPAHPLAAEVLSVLGGAVGATELTLESVLVADGPIPRDVDPIREVQRRFRRHGEVRAVLEARIRQLEENHDRMVTTTNAMTALAAILAVFGILGWLAALGLWEIDWLDPEQIVPEAPRRGEQPAEEGG